jgi:hypothetical protein
LFSSLAAAGIRHRLSFFVDDVVLLVKPTMEEATAAIELLRLFGTASSLFCNLGKVLCHQFGARGLICSLC